MKKLLIVAVAIFAVFTVVGCDQLNVIEIENEEEVFNLQALSSTTLLSFNEESVTDLAYSPMANQETQDPIITEEVENIDYYVEMIEVFLSNDNLDITNEESDNEDYDYKTIYNTININGESVSYIFYYNEFDFTTDQEPLTSTYSESTEGMQARSFHFQDEDDNLVVKGLEGILIYGDVTYNIEGKKVVNNRQEIFRLRSFIDEENYVMVNYQKDITDRNKEKFFFKEVVDNVIVKESKVMIFTKDNRTHVKLDFVDGNLSSSYIFNIRTEENVQFIHIVYEIDNGETVEEGVVRLTAETNPETGEVVYSYSMTPNNHNGKEYKHSFNHRHQNQTSVNVN
ncbi:MAG: hypothetical protein CVV60_05285 [Tenericutes bacterium HGW-Tenericutes-5]|nr:MAG: hypothetical protein CVV60_05285 [Tenericutes bacterium HGW-Tenericutes-5]